MIDPKYSYQDDDVTRIVERFRTGVRRVCYCLPTGGGKTYVGCAVLRKLGDGCRALVLAHRIEILRQLEKAMAATETKPELVTLLSPMKASRLSDEELRVFDLVIVDEAHRAGGATYSKLLARMPMANVLGLTASPYRREGLQGEFDELIEGPNVSALVERSVILEPSYWSVVEGDEPDLKGVHVTAGDYNVAELERVTNRPHLVGNIVREWEARAQGKSTLVFAVSIKHGLSIVASFREKGIDARFVSSETQAGPRERLVEDFDAGKFPVLVNVMLLTEGIDVHRIDCLVLARPTRSLVLFVQTVGRAMRHSPTGAQPLIHDHSGAWRWHGLPTTPRKWSLVRELAPKAGRKMPVKRCAECGVVNHLSATECKECGASFRRVDEARALEEVKEVQTHCATPGCERRLSMNPEQIARRQKRNSDLDAVCQRCAARRSASSRSPELLRQYAERLRKVNAERTPEQRRAIAKAAAQASLDKTTHEERSVMRQRSSRAVWDSMTEEEQQARIAVLVSERARQARNISPERLSEIAQKAAATRRKIFAEMSAEERKALTEAARAGAAKRTHEQRKESAQKAAAASTPEQRSERVRRANASRTSEQRAEILRKMYEGRDAMSPEKRSETTRKGRATMTPEQRSESSRKAAATVRARRGES